MVSTKNIASVFVLLPILFTLTHSESYQDGSTVQDILDKRQHSTRQERLFPVFQIVRFNNEACIGSGGRNGTCYTAAECTTRGGTNSGTCASGYGVCCAFDRGCGATSNENCTYFTSTNAPTSGSCSLRVCPCGTNICQLRLDFNQFVITGPTTDNVAVGGALFNNLVTKGGRAVCQRGRCLTDTFSVTNPGGSAPPVICGTNTGDHLYVDSSASCNDLNFLLGNNAVGATMAARSWNIKVTQYDCNSPNLAPRGCDQYFTGATGMVRTFNFAGGNHLADQEQTICVRRERGNCRICWTPTAATDFQLSGLAKGTGVMKTVSKGINNPSQCCNYGAGGVDVNGYDCVSIPGAVKAKTKNAFVNSRICGRFLVTLDGQMANAVVCSTQQPFQITFRSDTFENLAECGVNPTKGFNLKYTQDAINC